MENLEARLTPQTSSCTLIFCYLLLIYVRVHHPVETTKCNDTFQSNTHMHGRIQSKTATMGEFWHCHANCWCFWWWYGVSMNSLTSLKLFIPLYKRLQKLSIWNNIHVFSNQRTWTQPSTSILLHSGFTSSLSTRHSPSCAMLKK